MGHTLPFSVPVVCAVLPTTPTRLPRVLNTSTSLRVARSMSPAHGFLQGRSSPAVPFTQLDATTTAAGARHIDRLSLEFLRRSRTFTLVLLTLVVVLLFADQNLLAPNLSAIAEEFGFDEKEKDRHLGGDIAVAFFGFGAPASLLIGYLTDVIDRRKLFVGIVVLGEMGALATVFVTTFRQLYWTRAITGVAIGGGMPLVYSILGDLVSSTGRTEASGVIGIAIGFGQGMGQHMLLFNPARAAFSRVVRFLSFLLRGPATASGTHLALADKVVAGFTGSCTRLGWRLPFLLVALPCLALTALVLVATGDPPRGRLEAGLQEHFRAGGEYRERMGPQGLLMLVRSPTVLLVLAQGIPGCIPWGVITVYLPDFLHKQRGFSVETATVISVVFGVATTVGQLVGASYGQQLYNRRARLQPLLMGTTTIAGTLPCVLMIRYSGGQFGPYALCAFAGGFLAAVTGPNIRAVLMNVTLPSTRGTAFGVFNLFDDLGRGLGPALVSLLVIRRGREEAFTAATLAWIVCGTMLLVMALTAERDEERVQLHLADYGRAGLPGAAAGELSMPVTSPAVGSPAATKAAAGKYYEPVADDDADAGTAGAARGSRVGPLFPGREEEEEKKGGGQALSDQSVGECAGAEGGQSDQQPRRRFLL